MKLDYQALIDYASLLNKEFNQIKNLMMNIDFNYKSIYNTSNWNSITRDYFYSVYKDIVVSYDNVFDKFNNVNLYLDQVINNYLTFEKSMSSMFGEK